MKSTLLSVSFFALLFCNCASNDLSNRMNNLTARMDSLEKNPFGINLHPEDNTYKFDWFDLGKEGHHIVDRMFYVSDIKTAFKDNGYIVSGIIGNITSMTISNAIVECAIKDTTIKEKVVSGYSGVSILVPGGKVSFNIFIPTTKTNVSEIGVVVRDYRL